MIFEIYGISVAHYEVIRPRLLTAACYFI